MHTSHLQVERKDWEHIENGLYKRLTSESVLWRISAVEANKHFRGRYAKQVAPDAMHFGMSTLRGQVPVGAEPRGFQVGTCAPARLLTRLSLMPGGRPSNRHSNLGHPLSGASGKFRRVSG